MTDVAAEAEAETPTEPETPAEPEPEPSEPVEPIEGEDDEEEAAQPAEPTEPEQGTEATAEGPAMDEKAIEKAHKAAEKLRTDVAGRVGRIFGDDVVHMVECPLCAETAPGWIWNPQSVELQEDHLARVLLALNIVGPKKLRHHPSIQTCPTCGGEGQLETGSKVPGMNVIDCETCAKKGWIDTRQSAPVVPIVTATTTGTNGLTGPMHYTPPEPVHHDALDEDPAVKTLREKGFLVVPPTDMGIRVQ